MDTTIKKTSVSHFSSRFTKAAMFFFDGASKGKSPQSIKYKKYKKKINKGGLLYNYKSVLKDSIRSGVVGMRDAVKLQDGIKKNEWIAMNVVETYNMLLVVYGFIDECTNKSCPLMTAGPVYQYYWSEGDGKQESLDAPSYVDKLFQWVSEKINDENMFVTDGKYPKEFLPTAKKILSRMFRVYAHIYYDHYVTVSKSEAKDYLNKCFKFFYYFIEEFDLVGKKELKPLMPLLEQLK